MSRPEERRSAAERAEWIAGALPELIGRAQRLPGYRATLGGVEAAAVGDRAALARLPVLRKSDLVRLQRETPPFGGLTAREAGAFDFLFQSPGPIYEPGMAGGDWWRIGRFFAAAGVGAGDVVLNAFGYHLTPAGMMIDSAARAVGAAVIPGGTGQSAQQAAAAAHLGATVYAGTPDYLKTLLDAARSEGLKIGLSRAVVSGGALFPAMREAYAEAGIACLQCYATADLGLVAYESEGGEGMIVDEGAIVEIVTPGTGQPVAEGETGEVVVTVFNNDYPLIRFATGDLSKVLPGPSPCGRTNMRIAGWMGRADQTAKVKGMFVRPEQVAEFVAKAGAARARAVIGRAGDRDTLTLRVEGGRDAGALAKLAREVLKLRAEIEIAEAGTLPRDGVVIEDTRDFEG